MIKIGRNIGVCCNNKTFNETEILKSNTFGIKDFPVVFFGKNSYQEPGIVHTINIFNPEFKTIDESSEFFGGG